MYPIKFMNKEFIIEMIKKKKTNHHLELPLKEIK